MEHNIKETVLEKLREQTGLEAVREEDRLVEDLGISSLSMLMLLLDVEQMLSVTIDFGKLVNISTAGQLIEAIESME